jgi:hypothetical protein
MDKVEIRERRQRFSIPSRFLRHRARVLPMRPISRTTTEKMREVLTTFSKSELVRWMHPMVSERVFDVVEVGLFGFRALMLEVEDSTDLLKELRQVRRGRRKLKSFMGWGLSCLRFPNMAF